MPFARPVRRLSIMSLSFSNSRRIEIARGLAAIALGLAGGTARAVPPRYDHVVIVVEENRAPGQIIGDNVNCPYITQLAQGGVTFSSAWGITHPSQPNYLHLFSGSAQGVIDDNLVAGYPFTVANLGAELIAAGFTFRGYSEGLRAVGDAAWDPHTATDPGVKYRRKHNPWANWQGSGANQIPAVTNNIFTNFPADFTQLPTVSFVVPDQDHDMHDGTRKMADDWLLANLSAYANWAPAHNSLLIVTWDEDDYAAVNKIPSLFHGANLKNGRTSAPTVTHHNLLRTIEDMYGTAHASRAGLCRSISGIFENEPTPRIATFRQGLNGYADCRDTFITAGIATSNAVTQNLSVDGDYDSVTAGLQASQALVRFDNLFGAAAGQVPASAIILSAKLIVQTGSGASDDTVARVALHRMNINWSDADTWNGLTAGIATDDTDARSAVTFSLYPEVINIPVIFDVTSDIDAWKSGTLNYGWVIASDTAGATDGWTFKSSETTSNVTLRPVLEIAYVLPNTAFGYWAEDMAISGANADPLADPDRDGIVNVLEYAFRNDPLAQDAPLVAGSSVAGLPIVRRVAGVGGPRLELEYIRRKAASGSGLTYIAEFGDVPGAWQTAAGVPAVTSLDVNWERVIVQDTAGIGLAQRFGRVRVTMP